MTGTQNLHGPGAGFFGQIGRWLTLAAVSIAAAFMLFFSAAFALVLIGVVAVIALIMVLTFWIRAKLTGRPFGPRAHMDLHMADIRRQMGVDLRRDRPDDADGPVIDARQTPQGWTVER